MKSFSEMPAIDIEKTIILHLMACNVPESAIRIVRSTNADLMTLTVRSSDRSLTKEYSARHLLIHKAYNIVGEMVEIANWYHGGSIPVPETWWQSKDLRQRVSWLWFAGFTLFVILSIAKHLGWYE